MEVQNKYFVKESTRCNECCGRKPTQKGNDKKPEKVNKYNSDLYQFMKADSTAVVLITNNLSDATLEKVMRFTHARDLARIAQVV